VDFVSGDVLLFLDLHPGVAIKHEEYTQRLRSKGVKVYHVVYDLLPIRKPEHFWPDLCKQFREWLDAVGHSDGAICISRAVADELRDHFVSSGGCRSLSFRIGWFHLGADLGNAVPSRGMPDGAGAMLEALAASRTFLMVGTIEPRKGHKQTLAAFELLWQAGVAANLVIVGRLGWGMEDFEEKLNRHPQQGKSLFYLKSISDEYLERLYSTASCLIAASEGEGFGLPLIEAAQHGLPVIARDIPVFREVAGDYANYFPDSTCPDAIAKVIGDWARRRIDRHEEMRWLSWQASATQLMSVISDGNWTYQLRRSGSRGIRSRKSKASTWPRKYVRAIVKFFRDLWDKHR
jgi:glycosyltransferase involved in cell wall biosynthesis